MIKEIEYFTLLCDNCGADVNENEKFSCYADIEFSREIAAESDWNIDIDGMIKSGKAVKG